MSDLTDLIHLMDVKGKRLPGDVGRSLFHDHWDELRAGLLKADDEIERLKEQVSLHEEGELQLGRECSRQAAEIELLRAEIEGFYEDASGEDI